ncbi:MAG TPA: NAD(P)-binding protein, partial [Ktedonobacterales bacterium]
LIVGAGMAGLLAAHTLLARRPGTRVLLVEAGPALSERLGQPMGGMSGLGGAGLYLGGRLYLGPTTVPVLPPVSAPPELRPVLADEAYLARARAVEALLLRLGARAEVREAPDPRLAAAAAQARDCGLEYVLSYPARLLSAEERRAARAALQAELEAHGARFAFGWRMRAARRDDGAGFTVELAPAERAREDGAEICQLQARTLLLAPGRYGTEWLVATAEALGARAVPLPVTFGVRIELPLAVYAPLTAINPDPRLQMPAGEDAIIKTYATCLGGYVAPITRYGALVASGMPVRPDQRGPSTTVAILAQPGVRGAAAAWRGGERIAARLNERAPGRLIVQRLADARARRPTTPADLAANPVRPTCAEAVPSALHDAYPAAYWEALEGFLARIARLAPGVDSGATLLYGPAEERFWHFPTDDQLETSAPGLFVAGDAAGQSQGALQAGVAGALAGEGLAARLE